MVNEESVPIPYANVLLFRALDSTLLRGVVTAENGQFILNNLNEGTYLLSAGSLGYRSSPYLDLNLRKVADTLHLGPIRLEKGSEELQEVEVTARKPLFQQQADRLIVNVQSSLTAAGNSALDVLERSPGISVDRQTHGISMNGKSGVIVMINGKRSRMDLSAVVQMLQGMNASSIDRIELIRAPPARYDADGDAGIIHILLREHEGDGLNGSYSLFAGMGARPKLGATFDFNFRRERLNLFGNLGYNYDWSRHRFFNHRTYRFQESKNDAYTRVDRLPRTQFLNGQAGLDLKLSDNTILGMLFGGYRRDWKTEDSSFTHIFINDELQKTSEMQIMEVNIWGHYMGNLNLQHTFAPDRILNIDLDYLHYFLDNPSDYTLEETETPSPGFSTEEMILSKETPISIWVVKADYQQPLGNGVDWELGLKGTVSGFDNTVSLDRFRTEYWIRDPEFSQNLTMTERVGAAYTSFRFRFGNTSTLSLGLRYEFTDTQLDSVGGRNIVDREYGNFFPTVFYTLDLAEKKMLQFSYNRRITRPAFNQLAPFVIFFDPYTFFSGNANLRASLTDAVNLGYSLNGSLFSLQYSYDRFPIFGHQPVVDPERNRQVFLTRNLDHRHTLAATVTVPARVGNWWEIQNSVIGAWQETQGSYPGSEIKLDQAYLQINSTQTFRLPADFSFEISGFYRSPVLNGIARLTSMTVINLGLQKRFPNLNATLSLNLSDLLNQNTLRYEIEQPELYISSETEYKFESRILRLTYTQSFGSNTVRATRKRETGSAVEQSRVSQ